MTTEFLSPKVAEWVREADKVLAGDYDQADNSTRESLLIGLRATAHEKCLAAVVHIEKLPEHKPVTVAKARAGKSAAKDRQGGLW